MNFEWDEAKRLATLKQRGLDFADLAHFEWETAVFVPDTRKDYGEPRFRAFGLLHGQLHVVVFTPRAESTRIISMRKANTKEISRYENEAEQSGEA
jgi:uncharacterized DUF497 family protein